MQFIEKLRIRFHDSALEKEMRQRKADRGTMYLDNAMSVGILFDATLPENKEIALDFAEKLKRDGKKVKLLAFFDNKIKSGDFTFPYFNQQQLDWLLRPQSPEATAFSEQPFDLLLNISASDTRPLDYIAARSKAKLRVGPFTEKTYCYDLMIDHNQKNDRKAFLQQVVFYMKKMRQQYEPSAI